HYSFLQSLLGIVMRAVPALVGIFWGAPLLTRELETGTFRMVWTQTVTRRRWILTKLALIGLITAAITAVLTWSVTWWFRPIDLLSSNPWDLFDSRDLVPAAYSVFAFSLGALIGAMVRRTLPAMALTLAAFIAARVVVLLWVRPHLMTPVHKTM